MTTMSLFDYGKLRDTDKVIHAYLPHYAARFENRRNLPITLLEIGVMYGASLRMWKDYFPFGQIYGIDSEEISIVSEDRIRCFRGRQENEEFLRGVVQEIGLLDFIVDDGGHGGIQHVKSFDVLWEHVKPGGWYAIEDAFSLFDVCWTKPEDYTILHAIQDQWKEIVRSVSDIAEVAVVGCDTQKTIGRNNGLIFLQKAYSE